MATPSLTRAVGRWEIVAIALNDVVGSGIYLLPAAAAALLGPSSLWAVALAGLAVFLIVLCFAEASSHFEEPGSAYLYAKTAFGDLAGFQVGWLTCLTVIAAMAALANGFAQALSYLWPGAAAGPGRILSIALPIAAITALNVIGVKSGARTAVVLTIAKLVPLGVFVGAGLLAVSWRQLADQPVSQPGGGLAEAALLLLFAYAGFENVPAPAGEYKRPQRDLPFALLLHIAVVTLLYLMVQWVALGTLPNLGVSATPLADAARLFIGPFGGLLLTAGAAVAILGTVANNFFTGPRYLYALGRDGYGPRVLAWVHPRFRTPVTAILAQAVVTLALALQGSFVGLAALSMVTRLITYLSTAAAVPVLRRKLPQRGSTFRLPGGVTIPLAAIALTLFLAASTTRQNLVSTVVAIAAGMLIYATRRRT